MEQQQNATITMPEKGRVMIYACGGAGVNIGQSTLMKYVGQAGESFANVSMGFIDTSYSNFKVDTPRSSCYVIENTDGTGGLRSANYPEIQRRTNELAIKFEKEKTQGSMADVAMAAAEQAVAA